MAQTLDINVISSATGGADPAHSHSRGITIGRIQQTIEDVLTERISRGQISTVKMRVKKPAGAIRRAVRGEAGIRVLNFQFRIALGDLRDLDRGQLIRACQAAVPELVTANVPADYRCSLVIAFKDGTASTS